MNKNIFIIFFLICLGSISAQTFQKKITPVSLSKKSSTDSLKILAVLVEFQEDRYDGTVGTGKFGSHYTQEYGDTILDPLPHDAEYFRDHLEFAKNYYKKVSKGKLNISYKVLPDIITVSKTMRFYSPQYNSQDFTPLGQFAKEVWTLADQQNPGFDFNAYDLFIIFHAGVSHGADIGVFAIDRNLPSVYLSTETFKTIFGNEFIGFPTNNGMIPNTIIMPETNSREVVYIDDSIYLEEISINGYLVANIGNYVGLPDLYNTETGKSAIGRFGLMDSQGFNAYRGMFPPEPSPWEKIYLGWEEPILFTPNEQIVNISSRVTASSSDTTLLKIPINSTEYYLVENRLQDAKKDKVRITYKRSGKIYTEIIDPDKDGLYTINNISIPGGVVIDVDEFDAAVPGNGIVIWHIDEKIIDKKILENKINADDNLRGVAVVEADGINDIGYTYTTIFGDFIGEGTHEDLWYKNNPAELYKNRFSYDTKPNTNSNSGAKSLITLENFSEAGNKISFRISFGKDKVKNVVSKKLNISGANSINVSMIDNSRFYIMDGNDLIVSNIHGKENKFEEFSLHQPVICVENADEYVIGSYKNLLNIRNFSESNPVIKSHLLPSATTSPVIVYIKDSEINVMLGMQNGYMLNVPLNLLLTMRSIPEHYFSKMADNDIIQLCRSYDSRNYFSFITNVSFADSDGNKISLPYKPIKAALTSDDNSTIILSEQNRFYIIRSGQILREFEIKSQTRINNFSILADHKKGEKFILLVNGNKIEAYNFKGVLSDNFPILDNNRNNFSALPLSIDLNNDSVNDIVTVTENGMLYIFDGLSGKVIEPFPITIGASVSVSPFIYNYGNDYAISLVDDTNHLYSWVIGESGIFPYWGSQFAGNTNNSTISIITQEGKQTEFFPLDKTYNWPNPVYGNETNIRYFVLENSDVDIKIFDLAGGLVAELKDFAIGGYDNETTWNVTNIQSGVYYARVEVKSSTGQSASKIIKIAVVK